MWIPKKRRNEIKKRLWKEQTAKFRADLTKASQIIDSKEN